MSIERGENSSIWLPVAEVGGGGGGSGGGGVVAAEVAKLKPNSDLILSRIYPKESHIKDLQLD